jgi:isopentenyl-diphosphate delta-isomerase type 1
MGPEELFDVVDDDDRVVGCASRRQCHGNPALIHRAVHVLVFNSRGELLLQRRAANKDIQPDRWDTSVGGHLDRGETYLAAARREMAEELALAGLPLTRLYPSRIRNEIESENIVTYLSVSDRQVRFEPTEISAVRYCSGEEIEAALGRELFTPNFEEEWRMFKDFCRRSGVALPGGLGLCRGDSSPDLLRKLSEEPGGGRRCDFAERYLNNFRATFERSVCFVCNSVWAALR